MIAITGATGQLGRLVINALLKKVPASEIIAVVRSPEKAQDLQALGVALRTADYNQPHAAQRLCRRAESAADLLQRSGPARSPAPGGD